MIAPKMIVPSVRFSPWFNRVVDINNVDNDFSVIYNGIQNDLEEKNQAYLLPSSYLPMTSQEVASWKVYK